RYGRGQWDPWRDKLPDEGLLFAEAMERYLKSKAQRRGNTIRSDRSTLRCFETEVLAPGFMLAHVEERHAERFLRHLLDEERSEATLNTYHTRLKAFFDWCLEQ